MNRFRHAVALALPGVILLLFWQWASGRLIREIYVSRPTDIAARLWQLFTTGEIWPSLLTTGQELALGYALGVGGGVLAGVLLGRSPAAARIFEPYLMAFYGIPKIALAPLFIIWFGIGEGSKLATIGFGVFFPTVISTTAGVDAVSRSLVRMGQSFGLGRWHILRAIVLPGALPAILSAFRVTTSIAIILLVAAEMIGAERGIGAFVLQAGNLYDTENLMAGLVVLSVLGLVVAAVIGRLERWLLAWR